MIFRFVLVLLLVLSSHTAFAKKSKRAPSQIFYYPNIHITPGGRGYEGMGGDKVFFSYLHIALEILKNPKKYEIYSEGHSVDLYRGSRYYIPHKLRRKVIRAFTQGFPKSALDWSPKQKEIFLKMGPVTTLFLLRKIRRIRGADLWLSEKKILRNITKCSKSGYAKSFERTNLARVYSSWPQFYHELRKFQRGKAPRSCRLIYTRREKHVVKKLKRHRRIIRKPLLLIYGYSHDFGKYFKKDVSYLGSPYLTYASFCYHHRHKLENQEYAPFCSQNFRSWLDELGHADYFNGTIPSSLEPPYTRLTNARVRDLSKQIKSLTSEKFFKTCTAFTTPPKKRIEACDHYIDRRPLPPLIITSRAYYWRGRALQQLVQHKAAVSDFKKAFSALKQFDLLHHHIGESYFHLKQLNFAELHLNIAMKLNPKSADTWYQLGIVQLTQKNFPKAIKSFSQAIQINPSYAQAYNGRGQAYNQIKKFRDAIFDFKKALKLDPKITESKKGLINSRRKLKTLNLVNNPG